MRMVGAIRRGSCVSPGGTVYGPANGRLSAKLEGPSHVGVPMNSTLIDSIRTAKRFGFRTVSRNSLTCPGNSRVTAFPDSVNPTDDGGSFLRVVVGRSLVVVVRGGRVVVVVVVVILVVDVVGLFVGLFVGFEDGCGFEVDVGFNVDVGLDVASDPPGTSRRSFDACGAVVPVTATVAVVAVVGAAVGRASRVVVGEAPLGPPPRFFAAAAPIPNARNPARITMYLGHTTADEF